MTQVEPAPPSTPDRVLPTTASTGLTGLRLVESLGPRSWAARLGDGSEVAARWLVPASGPSPWAQVLHDADRLSEIRCAAVVPLVGVARSGDAVWLVSQLDLGVPLSRLVQVAQLSAAQAGTIAADVLDGLAQLQDCGLGHGRLHPANVHLGTDGRARLVDWAPAALGGSQGEDARTADVAAARLLVTSLARSAHPGGAVAAVRLAEALHEAPDLAALRAAVHAHVPGGTLRDTAHGELAALVGAVSGTGRSRAAAGEPARVLPAEPGTTARRGLAEAPRRASPVLWRLAAALLVVGLVVGLEIHLFGDRITRDLEVLRGPAAERDGAVPGPSTALPRFGASSAGPVTGVQARPVRACAPGRECLLRITVQLAPRPGPTVVRWDVVAAERCGDALVKLAEGGVTVGPRADHATISQPVTLPQNGSLAVGVVTRSPDSAASPAFPAPPGALTC